MTPVSVAIPSYNAETTIARAVKSVLAQTHEDWELIIVSDDQKDYDGILRAAGISDSRIRFATTGKTGAGPGAARNIGDSQARHDIIAHLDADDAYSKNYLEVMLPRTLKYGACNSSLRVIADNTGEEMPVSNMPVTDMSLILPDFLRRSFCFANIVIDRRCCHARWPEEVGYGEDLLFWLLILDELPSIHFCADARYDYYFGKASLSRPDESDTHSLCKRREQMRDWLAREDCPVRNAKARIFIMRWVEEHNKAEETFGYRLAEPDAYKAEMDRRLDTLIQGF